MLRGDISCQEISAKVTGCKNFLPAIQCKAGEVLEAATEGGER